MQDKGGYGSSDGNKIVAQYAERALKAFASDAPKDYKKLIEAYNGQSAVIALFGVGSAAVAVQDGKVLVGEASGKKSRMLARAATHPETISALADGRTTALEAFHVGDLVVRAPSEELHRAFGYMVKMSGSALSSSKLQELLKEFRKDMGLRDDSAHGDSAK